MELFETHWDLLASHRTADNTQTYMLDGWIGLDWMDWIYLRTLLLVEHLAVLTMVAVSFGTLRQCLINLNQNHQMILTEDQLVLHIHGHYQYVFSTARCSRRSNVLR